MGKNSEIKTWYYAHDADITYGEVHISPLPKILLACVILLVIASTVTAYIYRDYIYDYIVNPRLNLTSEQITLEVFDQFNPEDYIDANSRTNNYTYSIDNPVDTTKLDENKHYSEYTVTYTSKNRVRTNVRELRVIVKDTTNPVLTLKIGNGDADVKSAGDNSYYMSLIRGEQTANFNPRSYVLRVEDNYYRPDQLRLECSETLNFDQDIVQVDYHLIDPSGNYIRAFLLISVYEDTESRDREQEERIRQMEEELERLRQQSKQTPTPSPTQAVVDNKTPTPTKPQEPKATNTPKPTVTKSPTSIPTPTKAPNSPTDTPTPTPTFEPVENPTLTAATLTWSVSRDGPLTGGTFLAKASSLVTYIGPQGANARPVSGILITEQPDGPGEYKLYWESSDGLKCTQTVIITE